MGNDRTAKRGYVRECVGNRLLGRLRKRWIVSVNECLKKKSLDVGRTKKMVYDKMNGRGL